MFEYTGYMGCRWGHEELANTLFTYVKLIISYDLSGSDVLFPIEDTLVSSDKLGNFYGRVLAFEKVLKDVDYEQIEVLDLSPEAWTSVMAYACATCSLLHVKYVGSIKELLNNNIVLAVSAAPLRGMEYASRLRIVEQVNALIRDFQMQTLMRTDIKSPSSISRALAVVSMAASTPALVHTMVRKLSMPLPRLLRMLADGYGKILCKPEFTESDIAVINRYLPIPRDRFSPPFRSMLNRIARLFTTTTAAIPAAKYAYAICRGIVDTMAALKRAMP